jgi:GT2 family glycosyltransferase
MSADVFVGVVIVAHNNGATVSQTVRSVLQQRRAAERVVLIDSGSEDASWLAEFRDRPNVTVQATHNIGYAAGNNLGWRELKAPNDGFVVFLNPDVLLPAELLANILEVMNEPRAQKCAMLSPRLHQYDFGAASPTGHIDSTGIFPTWWGAWRDRKEDSPAPHDGVEIVPALCGAFLFARAKILRSAALAENEIFDARYFAYKEDIELSLRVRRAGWALGLWHGGIAWHGRG